MKGRGGGLKVRGAGHACLTNANINEEHNTHGLTPWQALAK